MAPRLRQVQLRDAAAIAVVDGAMPPHVPQNSPAWQKWMAVIISTFHLGQGKTSKQPVANQFAPAAIQLQPQA